MRGREEIGRHALCDKSLPTFPQFPFLFLFIYRYTSALFYHQFLGGA